ncbi:copper chaperone PCu(A)C [Novosphingobium sp. ERW19]|uniref:copper chaperone PCu(A)C n=1 Tax=Novosphingobium sp. ERW19 TaxID=2726186 RepID=UPI0014576A4E|nr:copper chaperone PCu(A)C [Novosphingobium sp. ERW19]NLR41530.1 copper chaperone PCu(A)C [Novosphingobium sp. ERW19]
MIGISPKVLALGVVASLLASTVVAHGYRSGALSIQHPWSRETAVGQAVGGGFLTIANSGTRDDRLLSGTSPVAAEVQLHTMTMDGGVMRMRQVTDGIAVPAKGAVELKPGGYHLMFMGLRRQLRQGERFPVTLQFQRAGNVTVQFAVQPVGSTGPMEGGHAGH